MSGHNKWSSIKHKKAAVDAKRGKIFTKLIKELTVAARIGGGDPDANPRLRTAIQAAKAENMPKDNIDRAIKKGTGDLEGVNYEELTYEGYGPGGAAVFLESLTDNKNRAVSEIRHLFSKHNGNLGENGCVSWMFEKKGFIEIDQAAADEETVMETAIEAGAEDVRESDTAFEVITAPEDLDAVRDGLEKAELPISFAEVTMLPQTTVDLEDKESEQMLKLLEALDDCEDVQKLYTNANLSDTALTEN
ncbi:MAG: YebC/PmpR family DNA-binding transcriptional regulator [Desulfosudaceae bacterium]